MPILVESSESKKLEMTPEELEIYKKVYDIEPLGTRILLEHAQRIILTSNLELKGIISKLIVIYIIKRISYSKYVNDLINALDEDEKILLKRRRRLIREDLQRNLGICVSNQLIEDKVTFNEKFVCEVIDPLFEANFQFYNDWIGDIDALKNRIATYVDTSFLTDQFTKGFLVLWLKTLRESIDGRMITDIINV